MFRGRVCPCRVFVSVSVDVCNPKRCRRGGRRVQINVCYPEEIVRYYSPNYAQGLLQKLDTYQQ